MSLVHGTFPAATSAQLNPLHDAHSHAVYLQVALVLQRLMHLRSHPGHCQHATCQGMKRLRPFLRHAVHHDPRSWQWAGLQPHAPAAAAPAAAQTASASAPPAR